ncbi:MAG: hypothetical protein QGG14_08870 [Planctomycetota bacterium]|nr:hypothetical protein [Planctomycetota bacterium]
MYKDVGVSFKGNASYRGTGNSPKKSFNVTVDAFVEGKRFKPRSSGSSERRQHSSPD